MRAYSMDLRERALLDSDAGMKAADVAANYRVRGSWVRLLKQRRRDTGEVAPRCAHQAGHTFLPDPTVVIVGQLCVDTRRPVRAVRPPVDRMDQGREPDVLPGPCRRRPPSPTRRSRWRRRPAAGP